MDAICSSNKELYGMLSQIKQEMGLILSRPGAHRTFSSEWSMKWAPAILSYCRSLKKKEILQVLANNDFQGQDQLHLFFACSYMHCNWWYHCKYFIPVRSNYSVSLLNWWNSLTYILFLTDDSEGDERLALILLLPLFAPKKTNATNCLYEKCLVSDCMCGNNLTHLLCVHIVQCAQTLCNCTCLIIDRRRP